jgi:DNA-directed RNA polymerase subunit RPC12/RpoP
MIKMGCANCGAPLEITPDMDVFACSYCGSQQRVERKGGTVALRRVEAAIEAVQRGTDRMAAELALARLQRDLARLEAGGRKDQRATAKAGGYVLFFFLASLLYGAAEKSTWAFVLCVPVGVVLLLLLLVTFATPHEAEIEKIRKQISQHRAVLDAAVVP